MEVWFNYGDTEIALDIRSENILENIDLDYKSIDESKLNTILTNFRNICIVDDDRRLLEVFKKLALDNVSIIPLSKVLEDNLVNDEHTLLISKTTFDPLFGYSGVPTSMIRREEKIMLELVKKINSPRNGQITKELLEAYERVKKFSCKCLEVIGGDTIVDLVIDEPINANKLAIEKLDKFKIKTKKCKAIVIGSGRSHTLYEALNALWNCINIIKEGSDIILLAECKDGLGAYGLEILVNNRDTFNKYYKGIENIKFLRSVKTIYNVYLVTALPEYHLKILGLKAFRSINDAIRYILNKNSKQKITLVRDASNLLLEPSE